MSYRMPFRMSFAAALLASTVLTACGDTCAITPIGAAVPVVVNRTPLTSCASGVQFDGRFYGTRNPDAWQIEAGDLSGIGTASGAYDPGLWRDPMVFSLEGVDPAFAIAMTQSDGRLVVLSRPGVGDESALCPYFADPGAVVACSDAEPST